MLMPGESRAASDMRRQISFFFVVSVIRTEFELFNYFRRRKEKKIISSDALVHHSVIHWSLIRDNNNNESVVCSSDSGHAATLAIPTVNMKLVMINLGANGKIGAHGVVLKGTHVIIGPDKVPLLVRDAGNQDLCIPSMEHLRKPQPNMLANGAIAVTTMALTS